MERNEGLGGKDDVLVAGVGGSGRAGSGSGQTADEGSFAAAGDAADEGTEAAAAADESASAFALAFDFTLILVGLNTEAGDGVELDTEGTCALEAAAALGCDYGAGNAGSASEERCAAGNDRGVENAGEAVAYFIMAGAERFRGANKDAGPGGSC